MMSRLKAFKYIWWINLAAGLIYFVAIQENTAFNIGKAVVMAVWLSIGFLPFYPPFIKYMGKNNQCNERISQRNRDSG